MKNSKKKICFVVGQHRSGTSVFTGLLNIFGASLGKGHEHEADKWNEKGYFEAVEGSETAPVVEF